MRTLVLCLLAAATLAMTLAVQADDSDLFATLDTNQDGFVTKDEVPGGRRRLFERLVRTNDKDSDGKLSREEFTAKPELPRAPAPTEDAGRDFDPAGVFKRLDRDGDGKLTKEEAPERIRENFDRIDSNSDGHIAQAELREAMARLGAAGRPAPDAAREAQSIFERLDRDGDGKLTQEEVPEERLENYLRAIAKVDTDGDKAVTKDEFSKVYLNMRGGDLGGRSEPRPAPGGVPFIRLFDADGNGEISADEIANASKALLKLDRNGDGKLTRQELPAAPVARAPEGPGGEQMLRRLKEADRNGDGKIQQDEAPPAIAGNFERADRNGDGELDEGEIKGLLERTGQRREGGAPPR